MRNSVFDPDGKELGHLLDYNSLARTTASNPPGSGITPSQSRRLNMFQKAFKLGLAKLPGENSIDHRDRVQRINGKAPQKVAPEKLLADLLRRQCRAVMLDVTECPPDTLPAHIARLDLLTDLLRHLLSHDYHDTPEGRFSGAQLANPHTLRDMLECLLLTKQQHRAPAFVNCRDKELADINRKLDTLAGLFANSPALNAVLSEETDEEEAA
jgi:hypothetical protein